MEQNNKIAEPYEDSVSIGDAAYPIRLRNAAFPASERPERLYFKTSSEPERVLSPDRLAVAIVGTRDMTWYGKEMVRKIIRIIAENDMRPVIISGFSLGVQAEAHMAAIDAGLPTIAVMGTGLDEIYPHCNAALAAKIVNAEDSAIITEYPEKTPPLAYNLLRRIRLIAGLCDVMIVVESKERGGGIVAARLAKDFGKAVYAVPGRMDDIRSRGCNELIRHGFAEILTEDVISQLDWTP